MAQHRRETGVPTSVTSLNLEIRTEPEYEPMYLRDSIRSRLFINGHPMPIQATAMVPDEYGDSPNGLAVAMRMNVDHLERAIIEEFVGTATGTRRKVQELEMANRNQRAIIEELERKHESVEELTVALEREAKDLERECQTLKEDMAAVRRDAQSTSWWFSIVFLVVTLTLVTGIILF